MSNNENTKNDKLNQVIRFCHSVIRFCHSHKNENPLFSKALSVPMSHSVLFLKVLSSFQAVFEEYQPSKSVRDIHFGMF